MIKEVIDNLTVGDIVAFGSYPQNFVEDVDLANELKRLCGSPLLQKSSKWKDYEYATGCGMYADCQFEDKRYRSVIIKKYRYSDSFWYKKAGYLKGKVYNFSFDRIMWRVLQIKDSKALLLSEKLLDTLEFCVVKERKINSNTVFPNNYLHSAIRKWLNSTFFDTAFSEDEKSIIELANIKNDASTTKKDINKYTCEDTFDRVFLLSYQEANMYFENNKARWKKTTEYAKSQGCYAYATPDAKHNNSVWWLRSPDSKYSNCVRCVGDGGGIGDGGFSMANEPCDSLETIAPAIIIQLNK